MPAFISKESPLSSIKFESLFCKTPASSYFLAANIIVFLVDVVSGYIHLLFAVAEISFVARAVSNTYTVFG